MVYYWWILMYGGTTTPASLFLAEIDFFTITKL